MSALGITKGVTAAILLFVTAGGCVATVQPEPYVVADYVPANLRTYPQAFYDGRPVYLVDTHWYYRSDNRWVYYREEPIELYRKRTVIYRERPYAHNPAAVRAYEVAPVRHHEDEASQATSYRPSVPEYSPEPGVRAAAEATLVR